MRLELKCVTRKKKVISKTAQHENEVLDSQVYKILCKKITQNKAANNKKAIMPGIQARKEILYSGLLGRKEAELVAFFCCSYISVTVMLSEFSEGQGHHTTTIHSQNSWQTFSRKFPL